MERFRFRHEGLEKLLEKAKNIGWSYVMWQEEAGNYNGWHCKKRNCIVLDKLSPMGEYFYIKIDFDTENVMESFMKNLKEYMDSFDINKHVEKWIPYRGQGGCPNDIRDLVDNAEDVDGMIFKLYRRLSAD